MERSFKQEVELLKLGDGETFHGEGILAVTKALLQSGVAYVGGYQGAPVSHMMDVLNDARDIMAELGVHIETNASEAGAAAMLGASINYPLRGAVTFKSTVGTNVASDALSNLASAGVKGGSLIVLGEDYGEGSSIIQERSQAFAMKSQMWLIDPRPNLPTIVEMVEKAFELSEASNTPVLLELRIRACHVHGSFVTKKNVSSKNSKNNPLASPDFDFGRISLPPATYAQEKHKIEVRWPAAVAFIKENKLNEVFAGELADTGIICQGGMYNATLRALQLLGLADLFGGSKVPIYCMNVTYPQVPEEIVEFCKGRKSVLVVEEGQPAYIEDAVRAALQRHAIEGIKVAGKGVLPLAGEYTGEVVLSGIASFLGRADAVENVRKLKQKALDLLGTVPARPPGFCVGCPERPVFAAMKVAEKETGAFHVSADIGCHTFATLPPFQIGHTVLGYGLGLASNSAINSMFGRRTVTIMGDGGFWHNGLTSGIANAVFNKDDGILIIMKNGYSSATGTQELPSSPQHSEFKSNDMAIERALEGVGVGWVKTVDNYRVGEVAKVLKHAMSTDYNGLKVIIAEGECQLERQRKLRPVVAKQLSEGKRTVRVKYGVDEDTCTGDHSCIRLSGCPTLTVKDNPDPLRRDPVATVIDGCVGCGLCGENAHAAVLCPSFYRAEIIQNPNWWDKLWNGNSLKEIESLRLGDGETFHGEGILAVTKALLQSGVSYVGGYQGAPVSHLLDVMVQARDYMDELGVHVEACTSEASAAAMLGASINYPARGAVTWKSVVGTNVAADALSYLASAGVMGGTLIVLGEDYGEGGVVAQERSHSFAMKSLMWLLDPRPNLSTIVDMVEHGFALSEASNTPVMMELRIRACHVHGSFKAKNNVAPAVSMRHRLEGPPKEFIYDRLAHPPAIFRQEKLKNDVRLPAARKYIAEHKLNEVFEGSNAGNAQDVGLVVQGGLYNGLMRALKLLGLADDFGSCRIPIYVLNAVYPLIPDEIASFAGGKSALLVIEEGQPEFIEQEIATHLRRADLQAKLHGKDFLQMAGDYGAELMVRGLAQFLGKYAPQLDLSSGSLWLNSIQSTKEKAATLLSAMPQRPPTFCVGCPERPVFSAMKLVAQDIGRPHVSMDVGCHAFASFEPFSQGNTLLGYGMSLASAAGVTPMSARRPVAVMGDGGFWHNGLLSGVASNLMNKGDGVLVIMKNGYASATGTQELISTPDEESRAVAVGKSAAHADRTIEDTLSGLGVKWLRTVDNYDVGAMTRTYREAMTTKQKGLKVIVAEGECQLERQRRLRPVVAKDLSEGKRTVRVKYGVDEDTCTGDHSCIRLSGCPTLTVKDNPDPLRRDPVATVIDGCVGCGLCGENAHAAILCPSFYRAEVVQNPGFLDKAMEKVRAFFR